MKAAKRRMQPQKKVELPFYYSTEKRLVHIVAKVSDVPGALANVLRVLGTGVNLIGTTSYSLGDGSAIFSAFAEVLAKSVSALRIEESLGSCPGVQSCQVWESKDGLLVDRYHTGLRVGLGEPYVMMSHSGLSKAFEKLVEIHGGDGERILFNMGYEFGADRTRHFERFLSPEPTTRLQEAAHIFEALGHGSTEVLRESEGKIRLVVRECFECSTPSSHGRSCSFRRGLIEGSFEAALNEGSSCKEIRCRLRGDEQCEFVVELQNRTGQPSHSAN